MPASKKPTAHEHFHKDGTLWARGELTDGVMTGYWEWFRRDGSRMRSGSFENGLQAGEWTTYDRSGRVVKVTRMKAPSAAAAPMRKAGAKQKTAGARQNARTKQKVATAKR